MPQRLGSSHVDRLLAQQSLSCCSNGVLLFAQLFVLVLYTLTRLCEGQNVNCLVSIKNQLFVLPVAVIPLLDPSLRHCGEVSKQPMNTCTWTAGGLLTRARICLSGCYSSTPSWFESGRSIYSAATCRSKVFMTQYEEQKHGAVKNACTMELTVTSQISRTN